MAEFDPLDPCGNECGEREVTCYDGRIFDYLDVKFAYDESWDNTTGWARKLNENFRILEQLIFGGSCGTGAGGLIAINAAGYTLNNVRGLVDNSTIVIKPGIITTTRDESFTLFKFVETDKILSANIEGSLGLGGTDYTFSGDSISSKGSGWYYCYLILSKDDCDSEPYGLIWSENSDAPNLTGLDENYIFYRKVAIARWDNDTGSFIRTRFSNGEYTYVTSQPIQEFVNSGPGSVFASVDITDFFPPGPGLGYFTISVDDFTDTGASYYYIGDSSLIGLSTGGQRIGGRGSSDASGAGDVNTNHFPYQYEDDMEIGIRLQGLSPDFYGLYATGFQYKQS